MAVLTDWAEDHEDVQRLLAIVDNYALDGVEVDIETVDSMTFPLTVDGTVIGAAYYIDDIPNAIENYLEAKYLNGAGR